MKKLNPPSALDHRKYFTEIISSKRDGDIKIDLLKKKNDVLKRYVEYVNLFNKNDLIPITDSLYPEGDASLLACYLSGGKNLAEIKQTIRGLQDKFGNEKCMYCQIKDPDSFDHYLPKDLYPEFCALAINLIPCCITCNKKKDKYWKELGEVGIINFYIDTLPIKQLLFADVSFINKDYETPIVKFILDNKMGNPDKTYKLVSKHYRRLGLLARYRDRVNSEVSELKRILISYGKNLSAQEEMDATLEYANQLKIDYGINYWKAILFESLSRKEKFYTHNKI